MTATLCKRCGELTGRFATHRQYSNHWWGLLVCDQCAEIARELGLKVLPLTHTYDDGKKVAL